MTNQRENPRIDDIEQKTRFNLQIPPKIRLSFWVFLQARYAVLAHGHVHSEVSR